MMRVRVCVRTRKLVISRMATPDLVLRGHTARDTRVRCRDPGAALHHDGREDQGRHCQQEVPFQGQQVKP